MLSDGNDKSPLHPKRNPDDNYRTKSWLEVVRDWIQATRGPEWADLTDGEWSAQKRALEAAYECAAEMDDPFPTVNANEYIRATEQFLEGSYSDVQMFNACRAIYAAEQRDMTRWISKSRVNDASLATFFRVLNCYIEDSRDILERPDQMRKTRRPRLELLLQCR